MSLKPDGKVLELLSQIGYTDMDDELMAFVGDYFVILSRAAYLIEEESQKLKNLQMSPEEKAKFEMIKQRQLEYQAKMKEEAEYKKQLQMRSEQDRAVKAAEKAKTSVANQLNFGANVVKFEPPKNQGG